MRSLILAFHLFALQVPALSAETAPRFLDPQVAAMLQGIEAAATDAPITPEADAEWIAFSRQGYLQIVPLAGTPADIAGVKDITIPGPQGAIPARLYRPNLAEALPMVVYFHGGGFTAGNLETHDPPLRDIAARADALVLSVDYRLAPENPFPAGIEDAHAAFVWATDNADSLGADPERIMVAGDSAGGNIATVVSLMARDRAGPLPAAQILIYPNTDLRLNRQHTSIAAFDGLVINRNDMDRNIRLYLRKEGQQNVAYASPLLAPDLTGMPRTFIMTAGADPLRDEGEAYAERLRQAGVRVTQTRYPGMVHGFLQMKAALDAAEDLIDEIARAVSSIP